MKKIITTTIIILLLVFPYIANASSLFIEPLIIKNVSVETFDNKAIIEWDTNREASARIHFGKTEDYGRFIASGLKKDVNHKLTLPELEPETVYHFKIISVDAYVMVATTNDLTFKTEKDDDTTAPIITNVQTPYITGTTATITWQTNKKANSKVFFGHTVDYNKSAGSGHLVTEHQVTLRGLNPASFYHFTVESASKRWGTAARYHDLTFRTTLSKAAENLEFKITNIEPIDSNSPAIVSKSATISWKTNKLASGRVNYGTSHRFRKRIDQPKPDSFEHKIILTDLEPQTAYYFKIASKDIFGKYIETREHSFTTKPEQWSVPPVKVLGVTIDKSKTTVTAHQKLVKTSGSPKVYAIINGQKHYLPSPSVFRSYNHNWKNIVTISQDEFNNYPIATLVKIPDSPTVYSVDEQRGLRKPIPTPSIFESYKENRWKHIITITKEDLQSLSLTYLVKTTDNPKVYLADYHNRTKESFADERAFLRRGFEWQEIIEINETELAYYTNSGVLE